MKKFKKCFNIIYLFMSVLLVNSCSAKSDKNFSGSQFKRASQVGQKSKPEDKIPVLQQEADKQETIPHNKQEAVVSAHYLATEAGMKVLEAGGNAADAAFTVAAVLSVVESWFSSVLGGGTWALYYEAASDKVASLDGVGPLASGATAEVYRRLAAQEGLHQAVVPGAWSGWMIWLERFGSLPLGELLQDAIRYAEDGIPASEAMVQWINMKLAHIRTLPETAKIYLPGGRALQVGETVFNREMGRTFRLLAGAYDQAIVNGDRKAAFISAEDYFYRGPLADAILAYSRSHNGLFELTDFHNFHAQLVEPISIDYKGVRVYQNPPNSQGITMLIALNILKGYNFSGLSIDSPEVVHRQVEAIKLAQIDKYYHVGDPAFVNVPVRALLSEEHAQAQRERIRMDRVILWPVTDTLKPENTGNPETTTYQIIDRFGNAASVTTSLGAQFLVIGDTGIHINNRMRMVSVEEGNPNYAQPGKKVRHTSNPYIALRNGKPYILGGNTGVDMQPQGQMQQFISVFEFLLSPQAALARPRFASRAFPSSQYPWHASNDLLMETGTPRRLIQAMQAIGHTINSNGTWGNANMLVIDPQTGEVQAGAEPRSNTNKALMRQITP